MSEPLRTVNVGLIGLGTVGGGVARLIKSHHDEYLAAYGIDLKLTRACALAWEQAEAAGIEREAFTSDWHDVVTDPAVDIVVEQKGADEYRPQALHNFSMYLDGKGHSRTAKPGTYDDADPIGVLDVTVLSNRVLDRILGIADLRTSKRIDFVGGIRGLGELKRRVDSGEMKVTFALYPVSMKPLIDIADTGNIMPPKTTWFEPKLRSGVVIHSFAE